MGDEKVVVEIIPMVGSELDIERINNEAFEIFKKYPGVIVNTWIHRDKGQPTDHPDGIC